AARRGRGVSAGRPDHGHGDEERGQPEGTGGPAGRSDPVHGRVRLPTVGTHSIPHLPGPALKAVWRYRARTGPQPTEVPENVGGGRPRGRCTIRTARGHRRRRA